MKVLLLALCLGFALASQKFNFQNQNDDQAHKRIQENSFREGREYLYHYDTQVMTSLDDASKIQAGFRLSCYAHVQFVTVSRVRVQFQRIVLYRINEPVVQWQPTERLIPEEFLRELAGDEASTMESFLQIPFVFVYQDGQVLTVELEDTETTWSANVKRGFASLFQLNLDKKFILEDSFPALKAPLAPHVDWYNVLELGPTGTCVTLYTVTPNPENDRMYVTKVRDYDQCLNRPVYINTMLDGEWAKDAEKYNPWTNGASVKYSVRGNKEDFLILSAVGEGRIVFSPYKNDGQVMSNLNQTLYLTKSSLIGREVEEIPEVHKGKHKRDNLRLTLPSRPVDCQNPFGPCNEEPKQVSEPADVYSADKIYLHLQMAARNTLELTSEEALEHFRIVKDMLRTSPESILKEIWARLHTSKVDPEADVNRICANIFWSALPFVGTEASAKVVLDVCSTDLLMTTNCTHPLRVLALKTIPTPEIIDKLIALTQIQRLTKQTRQAAYLTLGSFGYKLTREMQRQLEQCEKDEAMLKALLHDDKKEVSRFLTKERKDLEMRRSRIVSIYSQSESKIFEQLKSLSEKATDERILGLKALGNAGLPESLPTLRKFLESSVEPQILRILAVTAHRRIQYPETSRQEAIKMLLEIYLSTSETNEIRSMAFIIMAGLKPAASVLETVAMSLHYEKDAQVSSFVHSYLSAYANSTYRPDWPMKRNATAALRMAPNVNDGWDHSIVRRMGYYQEDMKRGAASSFTMLGDLSRYFGSAIGLDGSIFGLNSQPFEIGMNTEGMNPLLNKLVGPRGLFTKNKSLFDLLQRGPRDISPRQKINQIFRTLRIKSRDMPTPYGHFYFKMMGHELGYIDFSDIFQSIATTGSFPIELDEEGLKMGIPVHYNSIMDLINTQFSVPTEAGLPLSMTVQLSTTYNIQGTIALEVVPFMLESDREGEPPVALQVKTDLKPKVVAALHFTMGLDMFYLKPVVGHRGLFKMNAPLKTDNRLDLTYKRLDMKFFNPVQEKPTFEFLLEPFSEFMLITKKNESPVFIDDRRNIYSNSETRVSPISYIYQLKSLGYELALTGQRVESYSRNRPMSAISGRSLLNVFWRPLENAPPHFEITMQYVLPIQEAVANSYAQTYQEVLTNRPEQYGRDFSRMDKSGVLKFDKYGRPLPQSTEEIVSYSDPVDIKENPVNMQEMCNKFQQIFGKPMPFYDQPDSHGFVFLLDASSKDIPRYTQLESLWNNHESGRVWQLFVRVWRSAIPNYDPEDWQLLSEFGATYPLEVKEPKDLFDPTWQKQLMQDLEYLISLESHKVPNQAINMTLLNRMEQLNYPAMVRAPTNRVLMSLLPEQLYRLMNMSGSTIYNRNWDSYWRDLGPVYRRVSQEERLNVDSQFIKRDMILMEYLTQVIEVQTRFLIDLRHILSETVVAHAELPIMQWINYIQARTVYLIRDSFEKALLKDLIVDPTLISGYLDQALTNVGSIVSQMSTILQSSTTVSQSLDTEGKPVVIFNPNVLREVSKKSDLFNADNRFNLPSQNRDTPFYTTDNQERSDERNMPKSFLELRMALYHLYIKQSELLNDIQSAIANGRPFDLEKWDQLLVDYTDTLNILDIKLRETIIVDPIVRESLLLVTVQNEFCIELLTQFKKKVVPNPKNVQYKSYSMNLMIMKEQGVYIAERASLLYLSDMIDRVVLPMLDSKELAIFVLITEHKAEMLPGLREFQIQVTYNKTNMLKPDTIFTQCDKFSSEMNYHMTELSQVLSVLVDFGQAPKLYIMSELMDALHYLKYMAEFASRTLYSVNDQRRFAYLEKFSDMATQIQTMISSMSPIFNKYEQYNDIGSRQRQPILNTMPIDTRVLDVQDVIVQQKNLKEQLQRFVENPEVSRATLSDVLRTVVDRLQVLQETLKQNQVPVQSALKQRRVFERQAISAVWSKVLNQQRNLYEGMLNIYNTNRENLRGVVQATNRINSLESEIAQLEGAHEQTMDKAERKDDEMDSDYSDSYRTQPREENPNPEAQIKLQPLTPYEYLPTGVTALLNITWGSGIALDKNAKIQFMASRSVEQIMDLYRQMNPVLRSQDIVESINRQLSEEPWLTDSVMQKLNTFNHLHMIIQGKGDEFPASTILQSDMLRDFFKASFWNRYQRQPPSPIVAPYSFHIIMDLSQINRKLDLYFLDNHESDVFQGLQTCQFGSTFPLIQNYRPLREKIESYVTSNRDPSKCMVNNDKVYTFDNVNYQLPRDLSKKEALLAADCSDEKAFAITMVKSNTSYNGHIVKIINDDKVVEIIPNYLNTEVRVNGKVLVLDENRPITFNKKLHYDLYQPALKIVRRRWRVEVEMPLTGVYFLMEGTYIQIKISQTYTRRACGLCSNFDKQRSWEYEGPSKEVYSSPRLFAQSYILNKDDRHSYNPGRKAFTIQNDKYRDIVSHYKPRGGAGKYNDDDEDQEKEPRQQGIRKKDKKNQDEQDRDDDQEMRRRPQEDQCKPSLQTVRKPWVRHQKQCFSLQPVMRCPDHCKVVRKRTQKVSYFCLSNGDPRIVNFLRRMSHGPITIKNLSNGRVIEKNTREHLRCRSVDIDDIPT